MFFCVLLARDVLLSECIFSMLVFLQGPRPHSVEFSQNKLTCRSGELRCYNSLFSLNRKMEYKINKFKCNVDFNENLRNADFKLFVSFQITTGLILYKITNLNKINFV